MAAAEELTVTVSAAAMRYTIGGKEIVRNLCLHIAPVEIPAGFLIDPLSNFGLEKIINNLPQIRFTGRFAWLWESVLGNLERGVVYLAVSPIATLAYNRNTILRSISGEPYATVRSMGCSHRERQRQ